MSLPASRVGDLHVCPAADACPHCGGPILPECCPTVLIGGLPQARASDMATCSGPPDVISSGAASVLIRGLPAARATDTTAHSGMVMVGQPTVLIGGPTFQARPISSSYSLFTGKLSYQYGSSIVITGDPKDPGFQSKVIAALIRLETTPTMQRVLADLESTGHTLTIIPYVAPPTWGKYNAYCRADSIEDASSPGVGSDSIVAWDPGVHGLGPPGSVDDSFQPGADINLGHEIIHGVHNATGSYPADGPRDYQGINVQEDRNAIGLPANVYYRPGDPLHGTALPPTTGLPYTENGLRRDYAHQGIPSPVTGDPPVPRPSYYPPSYAGGVGIPW